MPAIFPVVTRAAAAALLLSVIAACQDAAPPTAPLDLKPRLTQLASNPVVNSLADPGTGGCDDTECTLREALAFASSGATITFSVTGTITLTTSNLAINNSLTISGPGADQLTVSGVSGSRVFVNNTGPSTISGLTITGGYVTIGGGAGVTNYATLTIADCVITGNHAYYGQGGGVHNSGTLVIRSSTISGNTSHPGSGAIFISTGTALIVNSTISGNLSSDGFTSQGIGNYAGVVRIVSSTITGNSQGVWTYNQPATATHIKNSLIWGNTINDVQEYSAGFTMSVGNNLIGTTSSAALATEFSEPGDQTGVTDAKIGTLAVNSPGKTATHSLLSGSPAIDAALTCVDHLGWAIATDQRGVSRPQGSKCDIGSYELTASGTTSPTFVFNLSSLPAKTYGDGSFSVTSYVTTNSSGPVTFTNGTGSVGCSVTSGGTVTLTGAAVASNACIIEASLGADATYTSAGPISQSFNIAKAVGSVTINNIPSSGTVNGSFTPTYTKLGDGTASTVSNSTGVCTVTSGVVDYIAAGTCLLQASVTAGTNHLAETGTEQSFAISLIEPTFTFDVTGITKTYGDADFSVAGYATTNSTGAVTFAIGSNSTGCSVTSAGMVTITGAAVDPAHCVIAATLAPDGAYSGAGPYEDGFNIDRAAGLVSISNMPSSGTLLSSFTPTYTKLGDGTASVSSTTTGVCTVTNGVVTFVAAGTCTLQASVTAGTNHLAATGIDQSVTVLSGASEFASSCSSAINMRNGQQSVTVTWENANPGVTLIEILGGPRVVKKQLAPTTTGSWITNVKAALPTYSLHGGTSRKETGTALVAGSCTSAN